MKKKLVTISIVAIVCIILAFFGVQLYWFYNPEIEISNGVSETKTKEMIMVSFQEKSIFGMSNSKKKQIDEFSEKNDTLILKYHELDGVYYVDADVVLSGDGMKIMYDVETYIDGERDFGHFEDTVPFVLTYNFNFEYSLISSEEALDIYKNK